MSEQKPATYAIGLGELIRAHRLYMGLSQRDMATRLSKDRRDYQRIENGRDACPPGMLTAVEALTDQFDSQVEAVLDILKRDGDVTVAIETEGWDWERNVAGRAALHASAVPDGPQISFTTAPPTERRA